MVAEILAGSFDTIVETTTGGVLKLRRWLFPLAVWAILISTGGWGWWTLILRVYDCRGGEDRCGKDDCG